MSSKQVGKWYVEITPEILLGWFEHCLTGAGGTLLFDECPDGLTLVDYDGVFELPTEVVTAIRDLGLIVEEDME